VGHMMLEMIEMRLPMGNTTQRMLGGWTTALCQAIKGNNYMDCPKS